MEFWTGVFVAIDELDSRYDGYVIVFKTNLSDFNYPVCDTNLYPPPTLTVIKKKKTSYNYILYLLGKKSTLDLNILDKTLKKLCPNGIYCKKSM